MSGYSGTPLVKKLGIKAGQSIAVVNAAEDFLAKELQPLPENVRLSSAPAGKQLDFIMLFVISAKVLEKELPRLKKKLARDGSLWVSWPKKSSGVETDLSFDVVQQRGLKIGLVDVKICAVNEIWSGLKVCLPFERSQFALKPTYNRSLFNGETCCVSIAGVVFQLRDTHKRIRLAGVDRVTLLRSRKNFFPLQIFFDEVRHSILKATTDGRTTG